MNFFLPFTDLEKAYGLVPRGDIWNVMADMEINGKNIKDIKIIFF